MFRETYTITKISISEAWLIWACKKKAGNARFSNIYHILCCITVTTIEFFGSSAIFSAVFCTLKILKKSEY